ncbi:ubiquitin carboxyl-terminal hydrolase 26-like [Neolamprologus brichardi]|uniref:ubiquitin carboxyl-terminal hydrolase 26-like n=1 Tax=Neolamprologus brichardi TaxID=32507 RepID=UPI001643F04C|nr:ubiquitin carboxyl-terminal hydrolase 26-like [Neolamprologus brichardi]
MSLLESTRRLFSSTSLANRYHGLINQGATDYLNSVLQVLFMTEDFREAVTRYSGKNPHSEFLDHHLKVLFDDLQNHTAYSYKITQKLGIDNVYEQRDAAEYLERVLRMTSPDASKIFHGQLVNKTICSKGHIQTDRDAPFWLLPLSLVDSCSEDYSVVKGIEEFFKPSDFCGENQLYCEQCDDKVDATMVNVIKHHPDVLCLLLKRFEFNYNYMSYFKITCSVDVPETLQIPESQKYELYAFLDHFGDLRGGHYSATIKIQEQHGDRWYQFDDTRVTELDFQPFQLDNTEKSQTTYLLFYSKKKVVVPGGAQTANNKYHGLVNQGATCYLNSVLQVLFMTEDFREAVKRSSKQNAGIGLLGALTDLFDNLQKQTANTHKIITQLGINRVYEQRDAAECIEKILTMTSPEASQIFYGLLANQITCSKGHKETDRDAPFWHLPLSLVDFYNQDYSVTDVIKHHPDVLILLLKRFSYSYMSYFKTSCFVEIPYSLQIPEREVYELYAVVDHFGGVRGGHYSATIKTQDEDRWYKFDDTQVTPLDYQPFQEKSQSAYLLFYRKAKSKSHNCYHRHLFLYIFFILLCIFIIHAVDS